MVAALTLLSPAAAPVALAAVVVAAAIVAGGARAERVRRALGLPGARTARAARMTALAGAAALLGVAAAQPALTRDRERHVRRDVQALFVFDTSRSMAAAASPTAPTRLDRATAAAVRLRRAIPDVAAGVATLTDRVLPDLLPVRDERGFDAVVRRAVAVESPPPRATALRATTFDALALLRSDNVFAPSAKRRVVVVLTDGESAPFDATAVARAGLDVVAVRFWRDGEAVYRADGTREAAYRPDPRSRLAVDELVRATGGSAFDERDVGGAAATLRRLVGGGPTVASGSTRRSTPLAPFIALTALVVLIAATIGRRVPLPR